MKALYGILTVLAVVALIVHLWPSTLSWSSDFEHPSPVPSPSRVTVRDRDLVATAASESSRISSQATAQSDGSVFVSSASGVPLTQGYSRKGSDVNVYDTDGVGFIVRSGADAVGAPGHEWSAGTHGDGGEILLEADSLLVVRGEDLARQTASILIDRWRGGDTDAHRSAISYGFIDGASWGVAVSVGEWARFSSKPLRLEFNLKCGRRLLILYSPRAEARDLCYLPPFGNQDRRDLVVAVHSAGPGSVPIALEWSGSAPEDPPVLWEQEWSWGVSQLYAPHVTGKQNLVVVSGREVTSLGCWPTGLEYVVSGWEKSTGAHGRSVFVHTGVEQELVLHPGATLRGRVLRDPDGSLIVANVSLAYCLTIRPTDSPFSDPPAGAWLNQGIRVPLLGEGVLECAIPVGLPDFAEATWPLPSRIFVCIEAVGFAPYYATATLGPDRVFDLGEFALAPLRPDLCLTLEGSRGAGEVVFSGAAVIPSGAPYEFQVDGAAADSKNRLQVFLRRFEGQDGTSEGSGSLRAADWSRGGAVPAHWDPSYAELIIEDAPGSARAYGRTAVGLYSAVPSRVYDVTILDESPEEAGRQLSFGWRWRGVTYWVSRGAGPVPASGVVTFTAPIEGAEIVISPEANLSPWFAPNVYSFTRPLVSPRMRVILPQ